MSEVIVLIPGILGSVLVKDGREVWGASGSSIAGNLMTFGRALGGLELSHGISHDDPKDGVTAAHVLPTMVPKFWKADGYGRLTDHLKERFTLTPATSITPAVQGLHRRGIASIWQSRREQRATDSGTRRPLRP
jgi:hypothetical protein